LQIISEAVRRRTHSRQPSGLWGIFSAATGFCYNQGASPGASITWNWLSGVRTVRDRLIYFLRAAQNEQIGSTPLTIQHWEAKISCTEAEKIERSTT